MKGPLFSQLEDNDPVWVVYNKNYENRDALYELTLAKGKVVRNYLDTREINVADRYEEPEYVSRQEQYMEIQIEGYSAHYRRHYSDLYDKKGQMLMHPDYNDRGPEVNVFVTKELAKEYITCWCEHTINSCNERIKKLQEEIAVNQNCINAIKDI